MASRLTYLLLTVWVITHTVSPGETAEPASGAANPGAKTQTQPASATAPKAAGEKAGTGAVAEKKALDSVLKWYSPDGGMRPGKRGGLFTLKSTDATTLYMRYVPATMGTRNALLVLPRFGRDPEYAAAWLAAQLKHDVHIFILYPRGHRPGRRFDRVEAPKNSRTRDRLKLFEDEETAGRLFTFDINSALSFIEAHGGADKYRLGLIAGAFFGGMSLRYAPKDRFAFYVLLSPHRRLYEKDLAPYYKDIKVPVVIVTGQGAQKRYASLIGGHSNPETEVISRAFKGRGFRLVLGWPGRPSPVVKKIRKLTTKSN